MKFPSPRHAFAFAWEVLDNWYAGRAFDPDPEQFRGGTGVMGVVHRALDVMKVADRFDPGVVRDGRPCDRRRMWFYFIYVDQPAPVYFTPNEQWRLDKAACAFCEALQEKGLTDNSDCKGKCSKKVV